MLAPQRTNPGVEETRARILAATREIFERNGTRGTTTREVAERAGVNEATLFRHFGSKAALIGAMREDSCGVESIRNLLTGLDGVDIGADIKRLAYHSVGIMAGQRDLMCIALAEDAIETEAPDLDAPEWRGPRQVLELLTEYFAARAAEGRIAGDPPLLGRLFMGMLFQLVVARKLWGNAPTGHETIDAVVDVFLNGVQR
ncbi:MAG TPA: helix-turn-helix domain-containing protein [Candidatus Lustribacter sp.]|jgi:AcrR family transcriptional regulator|nr:helix-turn-helix domain-containing protein [Candidatus Lustribacter sp.]